MDDPALYHDELLEHAPALEQLSYYLTREEQSANDLVQETMITALERPPRHRENLGGWLHTVARNLALRGHRTKRRRERRETEAARPESSQAPSPEKDEIIEKVITAVDELSEPYRTVIRMRFFDEMPPRAIAAELDRPIKTVKSQLHRGLGRLRVALEKEFEGEENIWAACLLTLILPAGSKHQPLPVSEFAAEPSTTPFWNSMGFTLSAIAVAIAFVLVPLAMRNAPQRIAPITVSQSEVLADPAETELSRTNLQPKAAPETALSPDITEATAKLQTVEARDEFGRPLHGGRIEVFNDEGQFESVGTTNAAGTLTFEVLEDWFCDPQDFHDNRSLPSSLLEPSLGLRMAPGETYSSSLVYWVAQNSRATVVIESGRSAHVAHGLAIDEMGFPVSGVEIDCYKFDRPRFRTTEGHLATLSPNQVQTDAQGRFTMSGLPDSLYWLTATKEGFAPSYSRQAVFDAEVTQVQFVMRTAASLRGRVTDSSGLPIPGATIQLLRDTIIEERSVRADQNGEYLFEELPAGERIELLAGTGTELAAAEVTLREREERYIDFQLQPPPQALTLDLFNPDGTGAASRNFEAIAIRTVHSFTANTRRRKTHHVLTTDSAGSVTFPPQALLPERIKLFELNEVGVRSPAISAEFDIPRAADSASTTRIRVELLDTSTLCDLRLRIVDDRGRLLPKASVQARSLDGQHSLRCRRLPGDDSIWIRKVEPGRYALFAQVPALGTAFLTEVNLKPGEVIYAGDLAIPAPATLMVDSTWWPSLAEVASEISSSGVLPVMFELHQDRDWTGEPALFSLYHEGEPRVSYEVLPGRYALRRVQGREILNERIIELEGLDGTHLVRREALESE